MVDFPIVDTWDLEFAHAFFPVAEGGRRWLPYGVPKLSEIFTKPIITLWGKNPNTGEDAAIGTGVLVGMISPENGSKVHVYAVTAYHVATDTLEIRINTHDGASRRIPADGAFWYFKAGWDDIAALDVTEFVTAQTDDHAIIDIRRLIDEPFVASFDVSAGDEGFMLGLFSPITGRKKNIPVPRFGCLAALADDDEPIMQGNGVKRPSHVFEMHSRPGHSGSPVFLYRTPATNIQQLTDGGSWNLTTTKNLFWGLLGIHSKQFWESGETEKAEAFKAEPILEGDKVAIPSSMTVIVPAARVKELLMMQYFVDQREVRERTYGKEKVRPEAATPEPESDNPSHKADFMSLLNAAARANKPAS